MSEATGPTGKSPHAFMREALGVQSRLREDRRAVVAAALAAEVAALAAGSGYAASAVDAYFTARALEQEAPQPQPGRLQAASYSAGAFADLVHIFEMLAADDPTLAANSVALIGDAVRELAQRPLAGRSAEEGLRERAVSRGRTGYVVLYRHLELDGLVLILAIRHRYDAGYPNAEAP